MCDKLKKNKEENNQNKFRLNGEAIQIIKFAGRSLCSVFDCETESCTRKSEEKNNKM